MTLAKKKESEILVVSGPKGGVGKTTIAANLAIALADLGKTVTVVDLDLGAANLHAVFGFRESRYTLDDFVLNKVKNLEDIVEDSGISGLKLILGGDIPGIANLAYAKKMKLIRHLSWLETDMVIMDLGAGTSFNVVDFAMIADRGLIVTTSEVPSLLNTYSFIKSAVFRRLAVHFRHRKDFEILAILELAKDPNNNQHLKTMADFLAEAAKVDPAAAESVLPILASFRPMIAVNRARGNSDRSAGEVVRNLMHKYLDVHNQSMVTVSEDPGLRRSAALLKPIMAYDKQSPFSQDIIRIAREFCL